MRSCSRIISADARRAPSPRRAILGLLALALAACQRPPAITLASEAAGLRGALQAALSGDAAFKAVKILDEGLAMPSRGSLRLSSAPGWALPKGAPPAAPFPKGWDKGVAYSPPAALAALGLREDGSWSCIPMLYDVWGATVFVNAAAAPLPPLGQLISEAPASSIAMAGGRPSARQALYYLGLPPGPLTAAEVESWFGRPATEMKPFSAFQEKSWLHDSWAFSQPDLSRLYKDGSKIIFLESYRDYEAWNAPSYRTFRLLASPVDSVRKAYAGTVLFLEYRGAPKGVAAALPLVRYLVASSFAKEAGIAEHWLAADQRAPELDSVGELARRLVASAPRFYPVTDRLPNPMVGGSLLVEIMRAVDQAPKKR